MASRDQVQQREGSIIPDAAGLTNTRSLSKNSTAVTFRSHLLDGVIDEATPPGAAEGFSPLQSQRMDARSPTALDENTLFDFEHRVNQLQHIQVSFLTEQFTLLRHECSEFRSELKSICLALEHEQATRELKEEAFQCEVDEMREAARRAAKQMEERSLEVQKAFREVHRSLHDHLGASNQANQESTRALGDTRDHVESQLRAQQNTCDKLSHGLDELRQAMQLGRGEGEVRMELDLRNLRNVIASAAEVSAAETADLRHQLVELRSACALEQRERCGACAEMSSNIAAVRNKLHAEERERTSDIADAVAQIKHLGMALDTERDAQQRATTDFAHQLSIAMETIQEEQSFRASEDAELSTMVEACKRSLADEAHRRESVEIQLRALADDVRLKHDTEVSVRKADVQRLERLITEQQELYLETKKELTTQIEAERAEIAGFEELYGMDEQRHQEFRSKALSVQAEHKGQLASLSERLAHLQSELAGEQRGRQERDHQTSEAIEHLRETLTHKDALKALTQESQSAVEQEARAREEDGRALSSSINALREIVEQARTSTLTMQQEMMQGQETLSKADASLQDHLDELSEALQQEMVARRKLDVKFKDAIQTEAETRQEVTRVIHQAIEECRLGLESHTHDMLEDSTPTASVGTTPLASLQLGSFKGPAALRAFA